MIIPPSIATYRRYDLPRVRLTNLYAEKAPSSETDVVFLPRPALALHATLGDGPIRGMFSSPGAVGGAMFSVSGQNLYRETASIGTITGFDRVSMTASATQLLIANDATLSLSDGVTTQGVVFPDSAGVSSVAYIDGYFLAARTGTQRFYWSAILDGTSWDALDYASAERSPGKIVAIWVASDQIWIFGEEDTEVWVTTGIAETPFQRVEGRLYDKGLIARGTVAKLDNTLFFVGHDFIVYRADSAPIRVSDNGIEEAIQASEPSQLRAWTFPWQGNLFYCLSTAYGTMCYNPATGLWTEFASFGRDTWRAHMGVFRNGIVYAGDDETGKIYRLTLDQYSDDGDHIERRWTAILDQPGYLDNIVVVADPGRTASVTAEPLCEARISRDGGETYSDFRQASAGRIGQYRRRIAFRRWGVIDTDGAVMDFRITDETPWMVTGIRINESQASRGRP